MASTTTMVHVRIDEKIKKRASKTLSEMGLSLSDAVRMMLIRVASEKALPFDVHVPPNAETIKAMKEAKSGKLKKYSTVKALFDDLNAED